MKNAIVLQLKISPREWRTAILFIMLAYIPMFGQNSMDQHGNAKPQSLSKDQIEFNERLDAFVDSCMKDQKLKDQYSEQRHTCIANKEVDITSLAMEEARHQFIVQNIEEYKQLFISAAQSMTSMDICENGGFEDDFLYYEGFVSTFSFGSDSCSPYNSGDPSFFIPATLPTSNRLEIVTSGTDSLVGINRTKFGNKALRINNRYGHNQNCVFHGGVDRITRKFIVTPNNRIFTVWYAVVLENPPNVGHDNKQPFLSIKCDLAPQDDLCYAADYLDCDSTYNDICDFAPLDVLDWTCHKFRIDSSYIGDTAILEITVADCGVGGHMGYAYIDGICEECEDSELGDIFLDSIDYIVNCAGDTARICGRYNPSKICNQNWWLDSILANGYTLTNFTIDTFFKAFCFDFPITNFNADNCMELFITGRFTNGNSYIPFQTSNEMEVCRDEYFSPYIDIEVGGCMDNTPVGETPNNNISDDYYYVYVEIDKVAGLNWKILRALNDPYPNEQDTRQIADGTGNAMIELGPFRIQEGGWYLSLYIMDSCEYIEYIEPPAYCSGCSAFYEVEIGNIQCEDDEWSFDLYVHSETGTNYTLNSTSYSYNTIHTISVGAIQQRCIEYTLIDASCFFPTTFIICPPKPCSFNCNLEVYVEDVPCSKDEFDDITFYVDLEVKWPPSKYACYVVTDVSGTPLEDGPLPSPQQVGPFTEDIYLTLLVCTSSNCTTGCHCYKTIYVPTPDCNIEESRSSSTLSEFNLLTKPKIFVQPNPMHFSEIVIYSSMPKTEYEIFDVQGKRIVTSSFTGPQQAQTLSGPPGIYLLKYREMDGRTSVVKIIKH
jgi:hypothetical protein